MFCYIGEEFFNPHQHFLCGDHIVSVMIDVEDGELHCRFQDVQLTEDREVAQANVPTYFEATVLFRETCKYITSEAERTSYCPNILSKVVEYFERYMINHKELIRQI